MDIPNCFKYFYFVLPKKQDTANVFSSFEENIFTFQEIEIDKEKEYQINQLQVFIDELKEIDKAIMLLYLEEKNHKEISEIIGISETNVGTKINRIKKILLVKFQNSK